MSENRKTITKNSDLAFIGEVGKVCPLCGADLILVKNNRKIKNYEIAHIYPLNISEEEKELLKNCKKLSDNIDDDNNKIALCIQCHRIYDKTKSVESYNKLFEIKQQIINKYKVISLLNNIHIDEDVFMIIQNLIKLEKSEKVFLTIKPVRVENKISDRILCSKVKAYVAEYYDYVNDCFKKQNLNDKEYENILMTFKMAYNNAFSIYPTNQQLIFESLVTWLKAKSNINNEIACEIVISYFVQHCEVFDDLS